MSTMPPSPFLEFPISDGIAEGRESQDGKDAKRVGSRRPEPEAGSVAQIERGPTQGLRSEVKSLSEPVGVETSPSDFRFVLDEDRFMAEIEEPPAFITAPSQGYLLACERDQTEAILEFMLR